VCLSRGRRDSGGVVRSECGKIIEKGSTRPMALSSGGPTLGSMQPLQLRKLVRKWTIPVIALTFLGAVVAYLVSRSLTPIYEAKGDVLVSCLRGS
jgi:hypothetical protein